MSRLFGETLRQSPTDVETASHGLLLRAGYIRQTATGIFSYLPLGLRALRKIESILRREMQAIGAQEIELPVIHPAKLYEASGGLERGGEEMTRFRDRAGRSMVIGMTHEEVAAGLAISEIASYRQLPALLFHIQVHFRDEARPRAGLIRAREFTAMDSFSFDRDRSGLATQHGKHIEAFSRTFRRAGLDDVILTSPDGSREEREHEFLYLSETGDGIAVLCESCGYVASQPLARFTRPVPSTEDLLPLEKVATPGADTIESLAGFLGVGSDRTAKVVFFSIPDRDTLVMALVRGDMEVSEAKLRRATGAAWLGPAEAASISATGAAAGYASPIGLDAEQLLVVVDELVATTSNLISGANEEGFHYRNVNFGRDFTADVIGDIAQASEGAPCPDCTAPLTVARAVEVGSLHGFGTGFTEAMGATYQDEDGSVRPIAMGSYGIGVGRLLACLAEQHHDEHGLRLPAAVAPYQVYLIALGGDATIGGHADDLYRDLQEAGLEVLYDDRDASGGVKFNDADLIGMPLRLTVGKRSLEGGGVEFKRRDEEGKRIVAVNDAVATAVEMIADLEAR
jgi:prolyl-tRNA synthetase